MNAAETHPKSSLSETLPSLARRYATVLAGAALFVGALWVVYDVLGKYRWSDVISHLVSLSPSSIGLAFALTVASYLLLTLYDWLGVRYAGGALPWSKVAITSFAAYAVGNSVGFSALSGGSIRYRLYSAEGLSAGQVALIVGFCTLTFALGTCTLLGLSLVLEAGRASSVLHTSTAIAIAAGALLLACVITYLWVSLRGIGPFILRGLQLALPSPRIAFAQVGIACIDLGLAASVLYVLLPSDAVSSYAVFLGFYLLGVAAGLISSLPGGIGVFESVLLLLMPNAPANQVLAAIVAYRAIYYFLPFLCALILLVLQEAWTRRQVLGRVVARSRAWTQAIMPQALSAAVFLCGAVLLLSGATPTLDDRLHLLREVVPLPLLEISHLLGSVVGLGLLLLAHGLQRRLDAAWHVSVVMLGAGIVASLVKGFDYEEALLLTGILSVLVTARRRFDRKASLIEDRFSPSWIVGVALMLASSVWMGLFSYRNVSYSDELWWQFAFQADAPRMLRASVICIALAGAVAIWRLLRPAPPDLPFPDATAFERARRVIAQSSETNGWLALLGDKKLMFDATDTAFVMFRPIGRSWVAMGDPVGPEAARAEMVWSFREACDRFAAWPVFYQVSAENLPHYIDAGLVLSKLGEEARVDISDFSLEGPQRAELRQADRRAQREGASFSVLPVEAVPQAMDSLRAISDEWLASKSVAEKGFSLGRFDTQYLQSFPMAVVHRENRIVAFANLWCSGDGSELSVDLMRHSQAAPRGVMDYLFIETMLWGRQQGYRWFSLGMAPLSGLEDRPFAPTWHRMGAFLFRHGEHFYNFEGLRKYKEKFNPQWRPRYLASPGGLALPRVLVDVTTLIAGSPRKILMR